ncbi:uncharacterized protein NDAI_0J02990 [Naumovozyma dairenensis CBS 421]|uniref:Nudix hydrolase domain-containing protein n=1 Tax=Naumovozyma dairenensis (strain ATCC 10597 / BCRC 20456 / CBS 421 / NBRC 0211 / NRRL Y-12639) TaxID=1071378 RepID=G0WHB3_NAUDC|nr:hypothetical protein NDAI_0J02990 [Naumovozyma dairenensis CBS 421]CCD27191.1 hypothetical protein NDAI_0J02990 [Naumovozyma dairenensis CBS 421]
MVKVLNFTGQQQVLIRTPEDESTSFSFLEIIDRVDRLPLDYERNDNYKENVYQLTTHDGLKIGFVLSFILEEFRRVDNKVFEEIFLVDEKKHSISFRSTDFDQRNKQISDFAKSLYDKSTLEGIKGWRNERYAVWAPRAIPYVLVERAMAGILGIITYGVHINGYVVDETTREIRVWVPRRSANKPTWPSMLDNIIAGGLGYPYGIEETVFKESVEEANLPKSVIKKCIKAAGVVSYLYYPKNIQEDTFTTESSFIVGEVEYIYDLKLDHDIIPTPNDGEVDSFNLFTLQEVIEALQNGEFKPNCALVMVDFLIRHGYITTENEPNYLEIVNKMHRALPFPTLN